MSSSRHLFNGTGVNLSSNVRLIYLWDSNVNIPFTMFRFFLLIMLITHSPGAVYFSRLCLYFSFLVPQPLIIVRLIFTRLLILLRSINFWLCSGKHFRTITIIIIYSTLQQFTVLGLRQNFNFKSRCVRIPAQDQ